MIAHKDLSEKELRLLLRNQKYIWAGNCTLKIYGKLSCASGKRMKKINRVFFESEEEAIGLGYRPCGKCMRVEFLNWKKENGSVQ